MAYPLANVAEKSPLGGQPYARLGSPKTVFGNAFGTFPDKVQKDEDWTRRDPNPHLAADSTTAPVTTVRPRH
ncbi:unnamed protein product [Nippostrongylus brasiliensis]|uniref:Homogentisate 1,2-dioxygenase n=1 Tax=Nippostrongylus brasiliensis TaxID=27835 RepID=A0A0N4Y665_NIPBR|nr:unnamed protein product [Nippostrongylus brasiliensis]